MIILGSLKSGRFSPYPAEQLAWGTIYCDDSKKALVFATPTGKLQMGWQNLGCSGEFSFIY